MNLRKNIFLFLIILVIVLIFKKINSKPKSDSGVIVDVQNFVRAECDLYIKKYYDIIGSTNKIYHYKKFSYDNDVIRMNLDTLYSTVIIDLHNSPVTITIPEINGRYLSLNVLDQDHYEVLYTNKKGTYVFNKKNYDTRYLFGVFRILVINNDIPKVNKIQDNIKIEYTGENHELDLPEYNMDSYNKTRNIIKALYETTEKIDTVRMFGKKGEVNELKHMLGVYLGWGGLSVTRAFYESLIVDNNDGNTNYKIDVSNVPINAFWSVIVYDSDGYIINNAKTNSLNNYSAKQNGDGSYTINFTNDESKINFINIVNGWNYVVRMYEPKQSIIDGTWKFPNPVEV